jgi:hypothetical protein
MKASLFCTVRYMGAAPHEIWPLSGEHYSGDAAAADLACPRKATRNNAQ